jgi:hypothetical protein
MDERRVVRMVWPSVNSPTHETYSLHDVPIRAPNWVIPPKANAQFVAAMEDTLQVYARPHDKARLLVCLDETSKQLVADTRTPVPMRPGQPVHTDYE